MNCTMIHGPTNVKFLIVIRIFIIRIFIILILIFLIILIFILILLILILLSRWNYSPMRTSASLMDFSQSALFFNLFPVFKFAFVNVCKDSSTRIV
jgi:hypothetical protein